MHQATQTVEKHRVCDIDHSFLKLGLPLTAIFVKLLKPQYLNYLGNEPGRAEVDGHTATTIVEYDSLKTC